MNIYIRTKILIILFFILSLNTAFSQLSKVHYIPPLTSAEFGNANPEEQYIYLSTPNAVNINYTIKPIGQPPSNYITGTVSNTTPQEIYIGTDNGQLFVASSTTSTIINNSGYIIEAEDLIYVSVRMNAGGGAQAGALVSKGMAALGNTFRVGSYTNENPQDNYLNFVSVMATEDNTQVTFSDLPAGLIIKNYTGTTPITTTLSEGESYIIATNSFDSPINTDGLIGTLVDSDKPIVVNCGSANGSFHDGGGRDFGIDQIVGLSKVGNEYIFVKGDGTNDWENILIVPHKYPTDVFINDNLTPVTINTANRYLLIEGDKYSAVGNMYVKTSEDVFAYQGVGATTGEANQGMFFVPPLSCETRGNLDNIANIEKIGTTLFTGGISIVTKIGSTVTINNSPISSFATSGPHNVDGNADYVTYKVTGLSGNISVESTDELYCAYFNFNGAATSGSFYSGFPTPPEINFDAAFITLGICIPNVNLEVANMGNFDSIEWYFDDGSGSGFIPTGNTSIQYTPLNAGMYKLIGKLDCSGLTLESVEVPVSICPDDIDNDGIIDNLDVDNDNDGILNCTESLGNENINLSNLNVGNLSVGSYTYSGVTSTIGNTAPTPFIGASDGTILSEVPNKTGTTESNATYSLTFNNNLNLLFEYATSTSLGIGLLTDDEEFIIQVPNTKTITLIDPDDQLLVDTNYDGIYETGVTQFSSFEIRFKLNGVSLNIGSGTFKFVANSVNSLTYTHQNNSDISDNQATFKISTTCIPKDNDNDGIQDALDYDSDNDGIPDYIEVNGLNNILSSIDVDANGLDDIFSLTATPKDSDNDGIWDFYDLDSDNDGISDLIETGQLGLLSDTDLNGVIDLLDPSDTNGWDNNAETTPDSGIIGYPLDDSDSDLEFSYYDSDSDGDTCSDVIEAGFSDGNNDGYIDGTGIGLNGLVTGSDGYTIPNTDYRIAAPIIIEIQPDNTESCEFSNTSISISSSTAETYQWEVSTDGLNWNAIVDTTIYSDFQTNTLQIPSTLLTLSLKKYRVLLNRSGNACGYYSNEITLTVIPLPIANIAPPMLLCDDDNYGTMPFDLTLQDSFINSTVGMTISYHASQTDAENGILAITSPFETGDTTIYARVQNDLNNTCYAISSFDVEVYKSAFPLDAMSIPLLGKCDNTSVGTDTNGFIIFDLTQREIEILNGQDAADFTLTYFTDFDYNAASQIPTSNVTAFQNTDINGQTIFVRMTNNLNGSCFSDTSFEIEVFELPAINTPAMYSQCDDISNDGVALFNLTLDIIKEEIAPNYITEGLSFTYFNSLADAQNNITAIPTPNSYQNKAPFVAETIWIRVETPNGCFRVETIVLEVNLSSATLFNYFPAPIYQCDDGTNFRDGVATFDLTAIHDHISTVIFPAPITVTVHFYENQNDAELENNEILDIANHQNTNSPDIQNIWVRVKSDLGNDCLGLNEFPSLLNVEALPIANNATIDRLCDDDFDGFFPFDVSAIEPSVLGSQNLIDVSITYFDSLGNQLQDINGNLITSSLPNPFLTTSQTITIRVTNNSTNDPDGACFDETTLEFIVDKKPVANTVADLIECDDDYDGFFDFDTSNIENTILNGQTEMVVSYFDENGAPLSPLPNPFNSQSQTITAKVENELNANCIAITTFDFIVNPKPQFDLDATAIYCLNLPPITVETTNSLDNYTYEWRNENNSIISTEFDAIISNAGNYTVIATSQEGCPSFPQTITIEPSIIATITDNDITVIDDSENNSIAIDTTNLGVGDYEFAIKKPDGFSSFYQDDPYFENLIPGIYTIFIRDKNNCGEAQIDVSIIGFPKFFTPNNDGINDTWTVLGVNDYFYPISNIYIFDRFGKLITQIDPKNNGWNGIFNGQFLPATDYWFSVELVDKNGTTRIKKGHFSLIRK